MPTESRHSATMEPRRKTLYRVAGATVLLVVGALIVVWAARGHFSRGRPNPSAVPDGQVSRTAARGPTRQGSFTSEERRFLLRLARRTVEEVVRTGGMPEVNASGLSSSLTEPKGCFVTLEKNRQTRGCIGHIFPREPLYRAVMDNARSAAIMDRRFDPVRPEELDEIEIEISVLTVPRPLDFDSPEDVLRKLRPHVDGVVLARQLRTGLRQATYLPQVWEQLPDKEMFLAQLSRKAELPSFAWREPATAILTYQVEAFKESEM